MLLVQVITQNEEQLMIKQRVTFEKICQNVTVQLIRQSCQLIQQIADNLNCGYFKGSTFFLYTLYNKSKHCDL